MSEPNADYVPTTHAGYEVLAEHSLLPWWYACEYPERLPDGYTVYVSGCNACMIALVAAVKHGWQPGEWVTPDSVIQPTNLPFCLEQARTWREQQGLMSI